MAYAYKSLISKWCESNHLFESDIAQSYHEISATTTWLSLRLDTLRSAFSGTSLQSSFSMYMSIVGNGSCQHLSTMTLSMNAHVHIIISYVFP